MISFTIHIDKKISTQDVNTESDINEGAPLQLDSSSWFITGIG